VIPEYSFPTPQRTQCPYKGRTNRW